MQKQKVSPEEVFHAINIKNKWHSLARKESKIRSSEQKVLRGGSQINVEG
jgi:hypothetical protein